MINNITLKLNYIKILKGAFSFPLDNFTKQVALFPKYVVWVEYITGCKVKQLLS